MFCPKHSNTHPELPASGCEFFRRAPGWLAPTAEGDEKKPEQTPSGVEMDWFPQEAFPRNEPERDCFGGV